MRAFSISSFALMSAASVACWVTMRCSVRVFSWLIRAFSTASRVRISASSTTCCRSISRCRMSFSDSMRACAIWCSLEMRAVSMASFEISVACSASFSRSDRSRASSARCWARRNSISRSCSRRASSLCFSISSGLFFPLPDCARVSASSFPARCRCGSCGALQSPRSRGQAFRIKTVGRIEVLDIRLVDIGYRHAFSSRPFLSSPS